MGGEGKGRGGKGREAEGQKGRERKGRGLNSISLAFSMAALAEYQYVSLFFWQRTLEARESLLWEGARTRERFRKTLVADGLVQVLAEDVAAARLVQRSVSVAPFLI
jgi:hypothetical protein